MPVEKYFLTQFDSWSDSPGFLTRALSIGDSPVARACAEVQKEFLVSAHIGAGAGQSKWR
jgi:hypothetical protein